MIGPKHTDQRRGHRLELGSRFFYLLWVLAVSMVTSQAAEMLVRPPISSTVSVVTNYYVITGSTVPEVYDSMRQSPFYRTNSFYEARTDWWVNWDFQSRKKGETYRLDKVTIRSRAVITMPKFVPGPKGSADVIQYWDRHMVALIRHELGHVDFAKQAAAGLQKKLSVLKDFDSAYELRQTVNKLGDETVRKYQQKERDYDRDTNHGATPR